MSQPFLYLQLQSQSKILLESCSYNSLVFANDSNFSPLWCKCFTSNNSGMEKVNAKRQEVGHATTLCPPMVEPTVLARGRRLQSVRPQVRLRIILIKINKQITDLATPSQNLQCVIWGGWSTWGPASACNAQCQSTKTRTCSNPAPYNFKVG